LQAHRGTLLLYSGLGQAQTILRQSEAEFIELQCPSKLATRGHSRLCSGERWERY